LTSFVTFLAKDDDDGGVDCVRQQEWCSAEGERFAISADQLLDHQSALNAGFFTLSLHGLIGVSAKVTFLKESTVQ
jgi:hypothetical protein